MKKVWWIGGAFLLIGGLLFVTALLFPSRTFAATSPDGRFTMRVDIDGLLPRSLHACMGRRSAKVRVQAQENPQGRAVPIRASEEFTALLRHASGANEPTWQDANTCSVFIETGDTRQDRIVWFDVTANPPKVHVTSLEAVDD